MAPTPVTVTYLQMLSPTSLRPSPAVPESDLRVREVVDDHANRARELYLALGGDWYWTDRRHWDRERWDDWIREAGVRTWLATHDGEPAGYFQLAFGPDDDTEITYFGLFPGAIGRGWGGWLLTVAAREAWGAGATRLWLHTCTLDHPAALSNYQRRGFEIFDRRVEERDLG